MEMEYEQMDMECERNTTFTKGSRKTGIFVLLGTVCMIILMIMTSVILFHQQRTFSELESLMNVHSSNQTSVKPDLQVTVQVKNIETLMSNLASSLSSVSSKQEENQQKLEREQGLSHTEVKSLMNNLSSAVSALTSKLNDAESLSSSVSEMKSSVSDLSSSVSSLSSQLSVIIQDDSQTEVKSLMNNLSSAVSALTAKLNDAEERIMNTLQHLRSNMSNKTADVPLTCKYGWISYKSSCFLFSSNSLNWTEARDYCKAQGALLLKIQDNDAEWAFLNHHTIPTFYWVGLTDQTTGQWRWADDTPYTMNKERWNPGQPDDWKVGEVSEDCGVITRTGKLNDGHCYTKFRFICRVQFLN